MGKNLARACFIIAPCKINLHLSIGERRPDGFHDLESLFVPLAFHDSLYIERGGKDGDYSLEINWELPIETMPPVVPSEIPLEKNLVSRAVSLFRERTGFKNGLFVRLDKRIPVGAGLGGGSSDAASCLLALNALANDALPLEKLKELALILGSDVPFFLNRGADDTVCPSAAFVSGRGDLVEPVKTPRGLWVLLVKPGFSSDTAGAFQLLDQMRKSSSREGKISLLALDNSPIDVIKRTLEGAPETWPFYNDFLPVVLASGDHQNVDKYREILAALKDAGASFAGLSGSGSCCFGVFKVLETAEKVEKEFGIHGNFVKLTFFLAQKSIPVLE